MHNRFDYVRIERKDGSWSKEGYLVTVSCGIGIIAGENSNTAFCIDDVTIILLIEKESTKGELL